MGPLRSAYNAIFTAEAGRISPAKKTGCVVVTTGAAFTACYTAKAAAACFTKTLSTCIPGSTTTAIVSAIGSIDSSLIKTSAPLLADCVPNLRTFVIFTAATGACLYVGWKALKTWPNPVLTFVQPPAGVSPHSPKPPAQSGS